MRWHFEKQEADQITKSVNAAQSLYEERNKDNIEITENVFRTAYECAQSHLSFAEHPRLINLQKLNGVKCENLLHSRQSCANITGHISVEMLSEIAKHIISNKVQFSVHVDESTSVANVQSLIVYLRTLFNGDACVYFLGLLPVESATAAGLEKTLLDFLHSNWFDRWYHARTIHWVL